MRLLLFLFIVVLLLVTSRNSQAQEIYNLRSDWSVQDRDVLVRYDNQKSNTVYFTLDKKSRGSNLVIFDYTEYSVFINGQLIARKKDSLQLSIDSLWTHYGGYLFFGIHQKQPIYSLKTLLVLPVSKSDLDNPVREANFFKDFVILASLLLMALMIILFRVNPRLTVDYLNVVKLFSLQERDEAIGASRIGSSINLFFFAIITFLLSLLLMIIFRFAPDYVRIAVEFSPRSTPNAFLYWIVLSCIIFLILIAKLILIAGFSLLFDLKSTVRFQFFSFIRLLFVTTLVMGMVAMVYFMVHSQNLVLYYNLLILGSILVITGTIFLFLKLLARTGFPVFHLFSYLCATEIAPLLILGKVILF